MDSAKIQLRNNIKNPGTKNRTNSNILFCRLFLIIFTVFAFLATSSNIHAQEKPETDHIKQYESGDYRGALITIRKKLNEDYGKRVGQKRLPSEFSKITRAESGIDVNKLFRQRKVRHFFIEENKDLFLLHRYAARCYFKLKEYDYSLSHFSQALQYRKLEFHKDDTIFHEIAQVYLKQKRYKPYHAMLEKAYSLNPDNFDYSRELGESLYGTKKRKKAIYHLERYIKARGDTIKDPSIYVKIANLNEDIGKYLQTVKYYRRYLKDKPDDGHIHFALGYLAFKRVGNHDLAIKSFNKSLEFLPKTDVYRRSKANEYTGDIYLKNLEYDKAIDVYQKTVNYQKQILDDIDKRKKDILKIRKQISGIKSSIFKNRDYSKYGDYAQNKDKLGKVQFEKKKKDYEYSKLNAGKVRWKLAQSYERLGKLEQAIPLYREAVRYDYNARKARARMIKLKLKIKRGY